jgi:hypothetical protein
MKVLLGGFAAWGEIKIFLTPSRQVAKEES